MQKALHDSAGFCQAQIILGCQENFLRSAVHLHAPQTALIADRRNKRNTGKNQGDCNDHQKFRQCKRSVPEFFCI